MMVTMSMMVMTVMILSACLLAAKSIVFEHLLSLFKTISNFVNSTVLPDVYLTSAAISGVAKKA